MSLDDKFRDVDDATTERRPLPLPPPDETPPDCPPVPTPGARSLAETIQHMGVAEWLAQRERIIEEENKQRHEDKLALAKQLESLQGETRDGFRLLGEQLLPVVTKLDERVASHTKQLAEHTRLLFALGDRQNEIVERQDELAAEQQRLSERVAALEARKPIKGSTPGKRARRK